MTNLSELYNGELKACPRCKGHKYIRGQKIHKRDKHLPNYKKNENGLCFLCDGEGKAFYTTDNRVLKLDSKYGREYIIEYCPTNGNKISVTSNFKTINKTSKVKASEYMLTEDDLFPNMYEMVWNDWSKIADAIFEEYPDAKAINIDKFYDYYEEDGYGDCISSLFYYNEYGLPIKPFYIQPSYDDAVYESHKGIVMLNKNYIFGVSGTYVENKKMLCLCIKTLMYFLHKYILDYKN